MSSVLHNNSPLTIKDNINIGVPQVANAQPFVKWVGGKRSLVKTIKKLLPEQFNKYYEPFVGGGAVYFALGDRINEAMLADSNFELVVTYNVIKKDPSKLIKKLRIHAEHHNKDYYYRIRQQELSEEAIDIAARFLYLNKTCYNGLYRVNKSGRFNTPIGNYKNPNIVDEKNILACHHRLKNTHVNWGDFESIKPERGDFVYFDPPYQPSMDFDPPYLPTSELAFKRYTKEDFTEKDQIRLCDFVISLTKKKVKVMLSNSNARFIQGLYSDKVFTRHIVKAPRLVNCKPDQRGSVEELLITNY